MKANTTLPYLKFLILFIFFSFTSHAQTQIGADIDGEGDGDRSGSSVSMPDAFTVAIGAHFNDGNGSNSGHVRIYGWNGAAWMQKGTDIDGEAAGDRSGVSVSMPDNSTVAIGAYYNDGNGINSGHVRIFKLSNNSWVQKGADIDGEAAGDESGISVSMPDSSTVAIGAFYNDGNGIDAGHVRIYSWNGSSWVQKGADIDGEAAHDEFGVSVSMPDSNTVAIGAHYNNGNGIYAGHARVFRWNGLSWAQKGMDIDGDSAGDFFGASVSMPDRNTVAIGALSNAVNGIAAGQVRVFRWNGGMWVQKGLSFYGDSAYFISYIVSMPDSNTIAIGTPTSNGLDASHVRIYRWNDTAWVQRGVDIVREAPDDYAAIISMPDSNTIAIGAPRNRGGSILSTRGHVRIFSLCNDAIDTSVTLSGISLMSNDSNATYQWVNCDSAYTHLIGETNRSLIPSNTGNYSVIVSRSHCVDTSACYNVIISGLTEQQLEKKQFAVFPNPSSGLFTIENKIPNAIGNTPFEVRDITGKKVLKGNLSGNQTTVDLSAYSSGVYLLRISDENMKIIRK